MPRLTDEQRVDRKMTERTLTDRVQYRARKGGWRSLHVQRGMVAGQWRTPTQRGFPDLLMVRSGQAMFVELKRELAPLSREQEAWIELLRSAGLDVRVWRPSDLRLGRIREALQ